jgi:hypothetical protein
MIRDNAERVGTTRWTAVSHSAQNDASPSRRRGASHATLSGSTDSQDESSDVFPKPAGAEISVSGP